MRFVTIVLLVLIVLAAAGCSGTPLKIPSSPLQPNEEVIGPAAGDATGVMLLQFIPIGQNDRFGDAYSRALVSVPGATRIVDITIREDWWWAYIMNGYHFYLEGKAVRTR